MANSRRSCCCCQILLSIGTSLLLTYLFLRPKRPICSIQDIYLPALDKSSNSISNHTILFDLKLDNPNPLKGIYYDPLNLTFSYGPKNSSIISIPISSYAARAFYQGHHKKTHRRDAVNVNGGVPWAAVVNGSMPSIFRVDLVTAVRIKNIFWTTKRRKVVVGADLVVNDAGRKVNQKGVRLINSGAAGVGWYGATVVPLVVSCLLVFFY